jgi:hypothetical protein
MLKYCGSENQKVINVPETLKQNKIILYYWKETCLCPKKLLLNSKK